MGYYSGQLIGGPDNGNFVSASVSSFTIEYTLRSWLDGPKQLPAIHKVRGKYVWNRKEGIFEWTGGNGED